MSWSGNPDSRACRVAQDQAEAAERVLAVAVLRALAAEGAHAGAASALLDASSVWAAYRGQRHDLFLPAGASARVRHPRGPQPALVWASSRLFERLP